MNELTIRAALARLIVVVDRRTGAVLRLADANKPKTMIHFNSATEAFFVVDPANVELKNAV